MINHKLKCVFVHIPKTSGTSIKNTLGGFSTNLGYHERPKQIKRIAPKEWEEYFKFTFVRNPYDRLYSIYSYYKMGQRVTLVDPSILPDTFEGFVLDLDTNLTKLGLNYNQLDFLEEDVDYVGKYETLQESFDEICGKLGVEGKQLNHDRKSNRKNNYKDVYTEEMIKITSEYFKRDIETFNYTF
jgi:chondroitin 4-sulfotransferase 11